MKKVFLFGVLALFAAGTIFTVISCDEDNPINCTQKAADYTEAAANYLEDDSDANCNTLKNAIEDYLDTDCPLLTDALRASLQIELEALPCY